MRRESKDVVRPPAGPGRVAGAVREAADAGFTGAAEVRGAGVRGAVYLDNGRIYWAAVAGEADVAELVSHLPVNGIVLSRIKWRMATGATLAEALENLDDLDHSAVWLAVQEATETSCRRLLGADGGEVELVAGVQAAVGVIATTPLPTVAASPAGGSSAPASAAAAVAAGGAGAVRLSPQPAGGSVQLDDTEWRVVAALASPVDVATLAERSGLAVEPVLAAIARMRQRGLVDGPPRPPVAPAADRVAEPAVAAPPEPVAVEPSAPSLDGPAPVEPRAVPSPAPVHGGGDPTPVDRRSTALRRLISAVRRI